MISLLTVGTPALVRSDAFASVLARNQTLGCNEINRLASDVGCLSRNHVHLQNSHRNP